MTGRQVIKKSQVILEITIGLVVIVILMVGAAKIFVWVGNQMAQREIDYNNTRAAAASEDTEKSDEAVFVDESQYPALDVLE